MLSLYKVLIELFKYLLYKRWSLNFPLKITSFNFKLASFLLNESHPFPKSHTKQEKSVKNLLKHELDLAKLCFERFDVTPLSLEAILTISHDI